jgi:hypothetical protein
VATLAEKEAGLESACPKCGRLRSRQVFSRFILLAGSKTEEDFDEGLGDMGAGDEMGGLPDAAGMEGLDEAGGDESGELDDFD